MTPIPRETTVTLRDGRAARLRPILSDDAPLLREFHDRLSQNTTRLRFFTPLRHLSEEFAKHLCTVDYDKRCAFVLSFPGDNEIHGVGRYEWESPHSAEVAFVVEDSLQGQGIGTLLLNRLAEQARKQGFERFTAVVLCENDSMLSLFRDTDYAPEITMQGSLAFVKLDISKVKAPRGL
jgi:GNAT superfamily N-acetyltransferase